MLLTDDKTSGKFAEKMSTIVKRYKLEGIVMVVGALAGWLYWKFVGCGSGQCLITSRPLNSTLYGAVMGALSFSFLKPAKK